MLFFGVAWHGSEQDCRDYVDEFDVPYDNALDRDDAVFADYGVGYQPATVLVTPSGGIFRKHAGPIEREELSELIEELLDA